MQANVKEILTTANGTGLFVTVRDRAVIGQDDLPGFNVIHRRKDPEAQNTGYTHYRGPWLYDCMITIEEKKDETYDEAFESADFEELENLFTETMKALLGDGDWEIVDGPEFGNTSVISGRETLGAAFTLAKHQVDRYE